MSEGSGPAPSGFSRTFMVPTLQIPLDCHKNHFTSIADEVLLIFSACQSDQEAALAGPENIRPQCEEDMRLQVSRTADRGGKTGKLDRRLVPVEQVHPPWRHTRRQ